MSLETVVETPTLTIGQLQQELAKYDPTAPVEVILDGTVDPCRIAGVVSEYRPELKNHGRYAALIVCCPPRQN